MMSQTVYLHMSWEYGDRMAMYMSWEYGDRDVNIGFNVMLPRIYPSISELKVDASRTDVQILLFPDNRSCPPRCDVLRW